MTSRAYASDNLARRPHRHCIGIMEGTEEKTKKKKKKSISEDGTSKTKSKKKDKDLKRADSKKKLKKSKSEKSVSKKEKKRKSNGDNTSHADDLPDSPLRDVQKRPLRRSNSLSASNHSTDLNSISEHGALSRPRGEPGRGMGGRGGAPPGRGFKRAVSIASMDRPAARPASLHRANSRGNGLSVSAHGPRPALGPRQASRDRGLSQSSHTPGSRPGLGPRQPSILRNSQYASDGSSSGNRGPPRVSSGRIDRSPPQRLDMDGTVSIASHHSRGGQSRGSSRPSLARTKSSHRVGSMSLSVRSLDIGFPGDPKWKEGLRYMNILPPTPQETPTRKKQRIFIWASMILDFIAALVSITTYDGVTTCCGVPIFDIASALINWDQLIRVTTYIYMSMIFIEIFPVFKKGLPINLINPFLGFTITFAMFFDDRIMEAVTMWAIEAAAIFCEVYVYRLKAVEFQEGEERVNACTEELNARKSKRRMSNDSFDSFALDDFETGNNDLKGLDKFRVERERRRLRVSQKTEALSLRYHFIGTIVNCTMVVLSLSLIIGVGKNGGLCIYHLEAPALFSSGQLELCSACKDLADDVCEICDPEGTEHQCYYPYL